MLIKYTENCLTTDLVTNLNVLTDSTTSTSEDSESKTTRAILHVNQFSRKLQRRLTRRTIAEAKALKQQGADTLQCLLYLADLVGLHNFLSLNS